LPYLDVLLTKTETGIESTTYRKNTLFYCSCNC